MKNASASDLQSSSPFRQLSGSPPRAVALPKARSTSKSPQPTLQSVNLKSKL